MVIAAHPDDEVLGMGATMARLINECDSRVRVVILGEGIAARQEKDDQEAKLRAHKQNILKAQKVLGYHELETYSFPDNAFDSVPLLDIVKAVEKEKNQFKPDFIFTHHFGDLNIDHRKTFEAVITATRPLESESVQGVLSFEVPSATEWQGANISKDFLPNVFIQISDTHLRSKQKAMESYEFERRLYPHPRSPEALEVIAKRWGINTGVSYAEAFYLVRLRSRV